LHSRAEENYLKAIHKLQETNGETVATSALAQELGIHAASATDMLQKMARKKLVLYQKSKGARLTDKGKQAAVSIIRNHRLWEVFLVEKLGLRWDEVHDIAEQLEHVHSEILTEKLDAYLGHPRSDPHGDPIPDAKGIFAKTKSVVLSSLEPGSQGKFIGVTDHSPAFLNYLDKIGLSLGDAVKVKEVEEFDKTYTLLLKGKKEIQISEKVANSLLVSA
jgi:DtxR family Mn-dependent transcriptional regulator